MATHGLPLRVEVTGWEAVCRLAALEVGVGLVNALVSEGARGYVKG